MCRCGVWRLDLGPKISYRMRATTSSFFLCHRRLSSSSFLFLGYLASDWIYTYVIDIKYKKRFFLSLLSSLSMFLFIFPTLNPHLVRNSSLFLIQIFFSFCVSFMSCVVFFILWWEEIVSDSRQNRLALLTLGRWWLPPPSKNSIAHTLIQLYCLRLNQIISMCVCVWCVYFLHIRYRRTSDVCTIYTYFFSFADYIRSYRFVPLYL